MARGFAGPNRFDGNMVIDVGRIDGTRGIEALVLLGVRVGTRIRTHLDVFRPVRQ